EDGIRDFHVTGVQTCALPIWKAAGVDITSSQRPGTLYAPHGNGAQCAGPLAGGNVYPGGLPLHCLQHIVDGSCLDFLGADAYNGSGHITSSLRTVANDHHFAQLRSEEHTSELQSRENLVG